LTRLEAGKRGQPRCSAQEGAGKNGFRERAGVLKRVLEQDSAQQALARSVLPKKRSVLMRSSVVNRAALTKTGAVLAKKTRS
jgi:hypothetical protein